MDEKDCNFMLNGDCYFFVGGLFSQRFRGNQRAFFGGQLRHYGGFAKFKFFNVFDVRQYHGSCCRHGGNCHGK